MPHGFVGRISPAEALKEGLDTGSLRARIIADRVSKAGMANADGFALPAVGAGPGSPEEGPVDVEAEMVSLADEQLRFEATSRLLQRVYQQVRSSLQTR